ncbi:hypothetical protein HDIA_1264 [Hartmannibacter diazotrophicus]|uniref:Glucosamine inositolphosphorylceramide transferase 1 N-terminal domain-containing protein n=1 Tax=Hartmannibacter diazotrophicus TaxID=1482074 RepID=A0A2C9D5L3_9HYPH|nr:hypothetical protein [Hartmannibacter diazotrophicus]SON54805.1 hypothetical protein HDIA_1264 [Hartmannibacter diazotrophicus]
MIVAIHGSPVRLRRWHERLAARLSALADVDLRWSEGEGGSPLPGSVSLLLELERLVLHRLKPGLADPDTAKDPGCPPVGTDKPDIVLDLGDAPLQAAPGSRHLRVLYDGLPGEDALFSAILSGRIPVIEIEDVAAGTILAFANPSPETSGGLRGGIDAVCSRVVTLSERLLKALVSGREPEPLLKATHPGRSPANPLVSGARHIAASAVREAYRLCCHAPHWRIGWRMNDGDGVLDRGDLMGPRWNVLSDPGDHFYADPVPVTWQGKTVLFFEDLDHRVGKGIISAVELDDKGPVGPVRPVLEDPWHLSYPFMIEHGGALYMIPETGGNRDVALYRCVSFPDRWERCAVLLDNIVAADVTIIRHGGRMWMFCATWDDSGGWSDCLSIFHAPDLFGPWTPLAGNPVLIDRDTARPAGDMVLREGKIWRPVQDCSGGYGSALGVMEVTRLDEGGFEQILRHHVRPGPLWPGRKLHTYNRLGRLEVIDGTTYRPKIPWLAAKVDERMAPAASV